MCIRDSGTIIEALSNAMFRVELLGALLSLLPVGFQFRLGRRGP